MCIRDSPEPVEQLGGVLVEGASRVRQPDGMRGPEQQLEAEPRFQILHPPRYGRLVETEALGGFAEIELLGDREEARDLVQVGQLPHCHSTVQALPKFPADSSASRLRCGNCNTIREACNSHRGLHAALMARASPIAREGDPHGRHRKPGRHASEGLRRELEDLPVPRLPAPHRLRPQTGPHQRRSRQRLDAPWQPLHLRHAEDGQGDHPRHAAPARGLPQERPRRRARDDGLPEHRPQRSPQRHGHVAPQDPRRGREPRRRGPLGHRQPHRAHQGRVGDDEEARQRLQRHAARGLSPRLRRRHRARDGRDGDGLRAHYHLRRAS